MRKLLNPQVNLRCRGRWARRSTPTRLPRSLPLIGRRSASLQACRSSCASTILVSDTCWGGKEKRHRREQMIAITETNMGWGKQRRPRMGKAHNACDTSCKREETGRRQNIQRPQPQRPLLTNKQKSWQKYLRLVKGCNSIINNRSPAPERSLGQNPAVPRGECATYVEQKRATPAPRALHELLIRHGLAEAVGAGGWLEVAGRKALRGSTT